MVYEKLERRGVDVYSEYLFMDRVKNSYLTRIGFFEQSQILRTATRFGLSFVKLVTEYFSVLCIFQRFSAAHTVVLQPHQGAQDIYLF